MTGKRGLLAGLLAVLLFSVAVLGAAGALASVGALAGKGKGKGNGNGKGMGREKVTLCHKGKVTIRVGAPALRAHLRHGDQPGACSGASHAQPGPNQATLVVFKFVINDNGGTKSPADFTLTIGGVAVVGTSSFPGSSTGVARVVSSGSYTVSESAVSGYALTSTSSGCAGTIAAGQERTCLLVNDDLS
jgi:hypothetical protein